MQQIEKLIAQYCPDGVEYKELGEVCNYQQPTKFIVETTNYNDNYTVPVLTAGQTFILGYTDETENIYPASKENPVIIFDDFTTSFHWVDFPFKVKSSAMKIITVNDSEKVNFRFIYYAMKCIFYVPGDHSRQWISVYSKFKIPIPPLEVQEKIVHILDRFTELENELESELESRRLQYDYYRDELLTFGEDEVEWKTLGELGKIGDGLHGTPKYDSNGSYYFINGNNLLYGRIVLNEKTKLVSEKTAIELNKNINLNDSILMAINGTIGSLAFYENEKVSLGKSVCYISEISNILNKSFLYYYLLSSKSQFYFKINATGSTIQNLGLKAIRNYKIPIPPLSEQERIVGILDRFDALVNDISSGIPAEIEARQQQYEYYRNELLSFKEKET